MRRIDIIRRAGRGLAKAKARTILTSLAIAVGAFTLTLSIAAGEGAREYANKLIGSNINPQALFIVKDKTMFEGGPSASNGIREYDPDVSKVNGREFKQLTQADVSALRARSDLEQVDPIYQMSIKYMTIEGVAKKYSADINIYDPTVISDVANGSLPALGKQIGDSEIVLPESYADTLNIAKDQLVGKKIKLVIQKSASTPTADQLSQAFANGGAEAVANLAAGETKTIDVVVRALSKKSATNLSTSTSMLISGNLSKTVSDYISEGTSSYQRYIGVTALAKEGTRPDDVKASLAKAGYPSQTAKDLQNLIFTIVNILQGIVAGFAVIALIASVFGIVNTQYISVLERTGQIGLMKALGMRRRDVAKLFRYEAAWIGFLGGVIGSAVAWALGTSINPWVTKQLSLGDGNYLLIFRPIPIAGLIVGLMIIAVIAGYFPARKAAKLDPIEALRTE